MRGKVGEFTVIKEELGEEFGALVEGRDVDDREKLQR